MQNSTSLNHDDLAAFIKRINDFEELTKSEIIHFFAYYILANLECDEVKPSDIQECFELLYLQPYSNISSYLSKKSKGKAPPFIKRVNGYVLARYEHARLKKEIGMSVIDIPVTDVLIPLDIFEDCPHYIKSMAEQTGKCFESALYDATLVMMRKLVETLIIECFERFNCECDITDKNGNYYYLSDLINSFTVSKKWNLSRNLITNIKIVKKYGDLSAHNRRFLAKPSHFSELKTDLRQVLQEIILLIDYKNWKR